MSDRIRRKDLKAPDEFVSTTQRVVEYARENPVRVVSCVGGILLMVVAALGVRAYREWSADRARDAFAAAQEILGRGNLEEAAQRFESVHAEHPGTAQGELALVQAGNAWAEVGKRAEAVSAFQKLLETTGDADLRQIALYNLGSLEKDEHPEAAAERLRRAAAEPGPLQGAAWIGMAGLEGVAPPEGEIPDGVPGSARTYLESRRDG